MGFYTSEKINDSFTSIRCRSGELLYLLEGEKQCALIDTGFGAGHLGEYVRTLTEKPVKVFLTHGHIDHAMGAPEFDEVYLNKRDILLYQKQCSLEERMGYARGALGPAADELKPEDYTPEEPDKPFQSLEDGMTFDIAPFHLDVFEFPGHTPGSMVFLIREMRILILGDACNNATFLFDETSLPLNEYKKALNRNRERLAGKYDRVFISHHVMEADADIMDQMADVCEEILLGEADDIPFEFMGMKGYIAKECNERFERKDGQFANIIYNKEKIDQKYLSIDVGGTFTKYAVITDECRIVEKGKIPTVKEPLGDFIKSLVDIYRRYEGSVGGIGLSMPGIIDSERGFMYTGGSLDCIKNLNIVEILEKQCGIPVTVENDAKCAALAEVWKGALKDCNNAIVVVCGTAVGGAVIHDRKVLKGVHNMTGEFSYIMTDAEPEYSLDNTLGGNTGVKCLLKYVSNHTGIPVENLDGEKAFSMANCGDENAVAGIREYVRRLAIQINNYQFIVDPEKVVIGGGISVQPLFLQMLKEELKKINMVYPWELPIPDVDVCKFFNDANLIGAVYVHLMMQSS